jgi:hypothetical protein
LINRKSLIEFDQLYRTEFTRKIDDVALMTTITKTTGVDIGVI